MDGWHREIVELHQFFEDLFLGKTESIDRAEQALDADFTMAGPYGAVADRSTVLAQLQAGIAHTQQLTISVPHAQLLIETDDLVVAEYIEVHDLRGDRTNERRTTVIFRKDPEAPNGVRWARAQETFIEATSG
ncbi:MAG: DUF4440 domain-containing protein [Actinomycetota bacterium]